MVLNINPNILPELKAHYLEEENLRKRAKFLKKCKETMWKRWTREYVRSLREQHRQGKGKQISYPKVGDAVIIQDEERNRNHWKMGIVEELIKGRDGIVWGAKVRTAKGKLERASSNFTRWNCLVKRNGNRIQVHPASNHGPREMLRPLQPSGSKTKLKRTVTIFRQFS